jgi:hypothetical protein
MTTGITPDVMKNKSRVMLCILNSVQLFTYLGLSQTNNIQLLSKQKYKKEIRQTQIKEKRKKYFRQ